MSACARILHFISSHTIYCSLLLSSMALQEVTNAFLRRMQTSRNPLNRVWTLQCRRYATGEAATEAPTEIEELEHSSFQDSTPLPQERASKFDPAARARKRSAQLPPSRYLNPHYSQPNLHTNLNGLDTASAPPNTSAAPCTHTSHPHPQIQQLATLYPAHSLYHD